MENTEKDVDYAAFLDDADDGFESGDALAAVIDSVHLGAPVTAKLDDSETKSADELPAWTDEELDKMSADFSEADLKSALAGSSEPLRELLKAEPK